MPDITVVQAPACHFCDDAHAALDALGAQYPLRVHYVEAASAAGTALVRRHRVAMFPLVLLDGAYFSQGRLPVRKLRTLLDRQWAGAR